MSGNEVFEDDTPSLAFSDHFASSCKSILKELQRILPCEFWVIAFHEQQWHTLYTDSQDLINLNKMSIHFERLYQAGTSQADLDCQSLVAIGAPIVVNDSAFEGVICGYKPKFHPQLIKEHLPYLTLLSQVVAYQIEAEIKMSYQKRKIQQLTNLSHTDSLTQLLNHRAWAQILIVEEARARRFQYTLTIFIIDLDNLKNLNDSKGHHAGDQFIIEAANCLHEVCRESDLVARIGGDEFGFLAVECDADGAKALLAKINLAFKNSLISASVGYCVLTENLTIFDAVKIADKKMYQQKELNSHKSSLTVSIKSTDLVN